jgi:hypothetical protein
VVAGQSGFLNVDHRAVAVPIDRTHPLIASTFVTARGSPAALRFLKEVLARIDKLRERYRKQDQAEG